MSKVDNFELDAILGGASTISGTVVSALTGIVRVLYDAGHAVGSSIRRIVEKDLCPLE